MRELAELVPPLLVVQLHLLAAHHLDAVVLQREDQVDDVANRLLVHGQSLRGVEGGVTRVSHGATIGPVGSKGREVQYGK